MQDKSNTLWLESTKAWLTLVEVIFAIIIFWLWIIVIMSLLSSNIWRMYDIREKDTALTISKEGIDLVYHLRDSNIERWMYWNCADIDFWAPDNCADYFYVDEWTKSYVIDWDGSTWYSLNEVVDPSDTNLYYHTGTLYSFSWWAETLDWYFYNHQPLNGWVAWELTKFRRTIEFRALSWYATWTWNVLEITSKVEYDRGDEVRSVILQSIIWDTRI